MFIEFRVFLGFSGVLWDVARAFLGCFRGFCFWDHSEKN